MVILSKRDSDLFSLFWLLLVICFDYVFIHILSDLIKKQKGQRGMKFKMFH